MTSVLRHPPLPRDLPGSVPGGGGSEGLGEGSAVFSSLNTANPRPCLLSVTNAPPRQVPYTSSHFNVNKPHNVTNLCKITMRLLHSMNIQMPMFLKLGDDGPLFTVNRC